MKLTDCTPGTLCRVRWGFRNVPLPARHIVISTTRHKAVVKDTLTGERREVAINRLVKV